MTMQTAARLQPCPACRRHTLFAITDGLRIRADPEPLGIHAEIAARLQQRETYDVITWGQPRRLYLEFRNLLRVMAGRRYPVVAAHYPCGHLPRPPGPADVELSFKAASAATENPAY